MEPLNSKQLAQRWPFLRVLTYFLVIFLPLLALMASVTMMVHYHHAKAEREAIRNNQVESMALLAKTVARDIHEVVSDLLILSESKALRTLLEGTETAHGGTLVESFFSWSKRKRIYDQIRFIDERGMEVVRVNFEDGNPRVVPREELQLKSHRYYFKKAFALGPGEVYISPFDLNVEHKEIEHPLKPMIRFATPAFDRQGRKRGIVVLNYFGATLIRNFERMSINVLGNVMLLNSDGFWLKGPRPEDEWAFMYEGRGDRTFGNAFPEVWRRIAGVESGQVLTESGLFTFTTVYPFLVARKAGAVSDKISERDVRFTGLDEFHWEIVCHVPHKLLNADTQDVLFQHLQILAIVALPLGVICWVLAVARMNHRRAEEALRQSYEKLQELETLQDNLTRMIVHDMRSPLMGIGGYLGMLAERAGDKLDEKEAHYVESARGQASELVEMVSSLLDVSKLETGEMPLTRSECDLRVLTQEVVDTVGPTASYDGLSLEVAGGPVLVTCDHGLIHRVIVNLVANAVRFTPKGGKVRVRAERLGAEAKVTVTDTGYGIPREFHEKIFEKFGQVEIGRERHKYSTGLGLTFCKLAVEAHGGRIGLESEVGKGSTFWFVLPA